METFLFLFYRGQFPSASPNFKDSYSHITLNTYEEIVQTARKTQLSMQKHIFYC